MELTTSPAIRSANAINTPAAGGNTRTARAPCSAIAAVTDVMNSSIASKSRPFSDLDGCVRGDLGRAQENARKVVQWIPATLPYIKNLPLFCPHLSHFPVRSRPASIVCSSRAPHSIHTPTSMRRIFPIQHHPSSLPHFPTRFGCLSHPCFIAFPIGNVKCSQQASIKAVHCGTQSDSMGVPFADRLDRWRKEASEEV